MSLKKGFTLIELLIVIAILAVLMVVLLVAINPVENIAKARDASRITAIEQLGKSLSSYIIANNTLPDMGTWDSDLVATGQPASFPGGVHYVVTGSTGCTSNARPNALPTFCYDADIVLRGAIVYSIMESASHTSLCTLIGRTYFVYSTLDGHGGLICSANDPVTWDKGTMIYVK